MANLVGYFSILIVFMVIAIKKAKTKAGWYWYLAGAGIQLLSLIGNQMSANLNGEDIPVLWGVYIVVLAVVAIVIHTRHNGDNENNDG